MIKLNRTTEYGLIALRHMNQKRASLPAEVTSAREIADRYGLPFEITAKTLQRLKDTGLIHSAQGAKGGYTLQRPLNEVTLAEFLQLMEGPNAVVPCSSDNQEVHAGCEYSGRCEIKGVMSDLNSRLYTFLSGIRLAEIASGSSPISFSNLSAVGEEP